MAPVRAVHRVPHNGLSFTTVLSASSCSSLDKNEWSRLGEKRIKFEIYFTDSKAFRKDVMDFPTP